MLAIASLLSATAASQPIKWFIAVSLIVCAYAFCFSLPLAATVASLGSALAAIGFLYAANVSL